MKKSITALALVFVASAASAGPALNVYFDGTNSCFAANGDILTAATESHATITNNGKGIVNVTRKGTCPTTSKKAVKWDYLDYTVFAGCGAGPAGLLPYWKYHMRPDGQYTLKCQSHPFGK